ncbi:MAG: hypothetical protein CML22_09790 [Rheinheimera sp.]|nr:hypothetical protein [Rheinheimera sp.]MBM34581.1 hypothetical protein [Rheinheimera sp.]HAW94306.1 hypothetical protein [Candidatus Azambacteria bacterium]
MHTNQNVAECAGLIAVFLPSLHGVTANQPYKMLPFLAKYQTSEELCSELADRGISGYSNKPDSVTRCKFR